MVRYLEDPPAHGVTPSDRHTRKKRRDISKLEAKVLKMKKEIESLKKSKSTSRLSASFTVPPAQELLLTRTSSQREKHFVQQVNFVTIHFLKVTRICG